VSKKPVTLYLSAEPYDRLKELVESVSQEVDKLIKQRLAELEGREYSPLESVNYEALKNSHFNLVRKVDKLEKHMRKRGVYNDLLDLAYDFGLDGDSLGNLHEVAAKMLKKWVGIKEDVHQFISLLEAVKDKKDVEKRLGRIRSHPPES